ncbi:hypothetical protein ACFYZJ_33115 [Streptomyces sp. NPDC001848]|uniref:hypothetical protein n=1 Tax=Streptomyces sp. NPDC001848 TaxID=3364618 RepID=UPI00368E4450
MERRLEAGGFQRIAWSILVWGSLGLLVWAPFLYVAIRRRRPSDWGAFGSFMLYECVTLPWAATEGEGAGDPILGVVVMVSLLTATGMLLFALFDRPTPKPVGMYGAMPAPQPQPLQRNPYMR